MPRPETFSEAACVATPSAPEPFDTVAGSTQGTSSDAGSQDPSRRKKFKQAQQEKESSPPPFSPVTPPGHEHRQPPRLATLRGSTTLRRKTARLTSSVPTGGTGSFTTTGREQDCPRFVKQWADTWQSNDQDGGEWHLASLTWHNGVVQETWRCYNPSS